MHLLYSLISVMLVGVLALSAMQMSAHSEQRIIANEITTQVTGVADEVFDHAGAYWYDEAVNESNSHRQPPIFPVITSASGLTPVTHAPGMGSDGWGGCTAAIYDTDANMGKRRLQNSARPVTCDDLDDMHGLELDMDRDGLTYTVNVAVEYVDPYAPTSTSSSQTFAKRMTLTIATNDYLIGGDPLEVEMSRVYTYKRITATPSP